MYTFKASRRVGVVGMQTASPVNFISILLQKSKSLRLLTQRTANLPSKQEEDDGGGRKRLSLDSLVVVNVK